MGIEPITQSNSTAPEHRRAALLRRVCEGRPPVRDGHCGGSVGVRDQPSKPGDRRSCKLGRPADLFPDNAAERFF